MATHIPRCNSSFLIAAACLLALGVSACGAEPGSLETESGAQSQELTACTTAVQPIVSATASSQQAGAFAPKYAIDGNTSTRWSSTKAAEQWLALDLGRVVDVSQLNINWQTAYSKTYYLESSPDGVGNWEVFAFAGATRSGVQSVAAFARTRYVRIRSVEATSWGNVSIVDVQVLGSVSCGNALPGPWALASENIEPPSFDVSTLYAIRGNTIDFKYSGKAFTLLGSHPAGLHFTQPVAVVQGGSYRLRLDVTNVSGASTTVFNARITGSGAFKEVTVDGPGSGAIDLVVSTAPGATPTLELVSTPITVFPGAGVQDYTVAATLYRTN
jgi:hypothetical protein